MTAPLTLLYVPGDREDRIGRAFAAGADVVIVDLEDAVTVDRKAVSRQGAERALSSRASSAGGAPGCQVRVNAVGTPWSTRDLEMVRRLPAHVGLRIPKCEEPRDVVRIAEAVGDRALHLLIESARGVEAAYALASAHPAVASIGLGEADLRADLGVTDDAGLLWARSRVVVAAAAAGLAAPAMSVYTNVRDLDALRESSLVGKSLGFVGRTAIHPAQLSVIREVFSPSAVELDLARELVSAAEAGAAAGRGAIALADGRFVDEAVVRQARRVIARAGTES
ncbi:CoA ester lyase [Intrasporangium sp. YIM S08009]|uniref:HpcH/HpaI aldolase/citrate lyase family protein n=1 Tax=Intrasporangium zincisolvens TaxID=3080018 RepID=UPI002B05C9A6|nr:CoA ester lyase [Intrasporangium sp. YIM S08009]